MAAVAAQGLAIIAAQAREMEAQDTELAEEAALTQEQVALEELLAAVAGAADFVLTTTLAALEGLELAVAEFALDKSLHQYLEEGAEATAAAGLIPALEGAAAAEPLWEEIFSSKIKPL